MATFKEKLFDSYPLYKWKTCDTLPTRKDVTDVFDFTQSIFFCKQPLPFVADSIFRNLKTNEDADAHANTWFQKMQHATPSCPKTYIRVPYPNEYGMKSAILMVVDSADYNALSDPQKEYYVTINAYINLVLRKCIHRSWKEIELSPALPYPTLHWVWFCKKGYHLTHLIWERAQTWLTMNPDMQFVLWTDMEDSKELQEFLTDVQNPEPFWNGQISIKYFQDTLNFVKYYSSKYILPNFDTESYLHLLQSREHGYTLIAKTDYLRAMILHDQGGFYADFNDCVCMIPIRYWFHEMYHTQKSSFILPCDTFSPHQISNYFIFTPSRCTEFEILHRKTLSSFKSLLKFVKDYVPIKKVIGRLFSGYAKTLWQNMRRTHTTEATKELAKLMIPAFNDPSVINALSAEINFDIRKGLSLSDPRAKIFFPVYVYKYLSEKYKRPNLKKVYDYFSNEFTKIVQFNQDNSGHVTITYFNRGYKEEFEDHDLVMNEYDAVLELLDHCCDDEDILESLHYQFLRNFTFIAMDMTNIMMHVTNPCMRNLVPFSYLLMNTTNMTLVGHYGDGSSMQRS